MTSNVLNPPVEAVVCRRMIAALTTRRENLDMVLKTRVLEREDYLQTISKRIALDEAIKELTAIYDKEFNI